MGKLVLECDQLAKMQRIDDLPAAREHEDPVEQQEDNGEYNDRGWVTRQLVVVCYRDIPIGSQAFD